MYEHGQVGNVRTGRSGQRSVISEVPAAVPLLFHNSSPVSGRFTVNTSEPLALKRLSGVDDSNPGRISRTSVVPANVPSLRQSSTPVFASSSKAVKYKTPPTLVKRPGYIQDAFVAFDGHRASARAIRLEQFIVIALTIASEK